MKKVFLLTNIILLVFVFSCESENEDTNDTKDQEQVNNNKPNDTTVDNDDVDLVVNNTDYILPKIITSFANRISTNQANINGLVEIATLSIGDTANGKSPKFTETGFIWGTNNDLDIKKDNKIPFPGELISFAVTLDNLDSNKKYYYQTYVTNADNEFEFGEILSFTTQGMASCSFDQENYIAPMFNSYQPLNVDKVELGEPVGFDDGNIQFEASSSNSRIRIFIMLNELDKKLPLSGKYKGIINNFDNLSIKSNNEVKITVQDFNGFTNFFPQGGINDENSEIYIENNGTSVKFIFCKTTIGEYLLNGEFTYTISKK